MYAVNLHVDGHHRVGSGGSITIGKTTIDGNWNITYGSIKPHSENVTLSDKNMIGMEE